MPLKSKPKLPVTIKLQSCCWFYFGKKKKSERERERGGGVYVEEQKAGRRGGGSLSNIWNQSVCKRGGTGRDGWGGKKEAEEEKNQMKIRTDTQEKEECG